MPELPAILLYLHALRPRVVGQTIERIRVVSPFVLRTFEPDVDELVGRVIVSVDRIGKRIVFEASQRHGEGENDPIFLVIHLMIAGRFRWDAKSGAKTPGKIGLASILFENGTLHLVESSQKKRAAIHLLSGRVALSTLFPRGLDVFTIDVTRFATQLCRENHTLKRSLTDPRMFDGIGNAYSDEILHAARLSPVKLTQKLHDDEIARLFDAIRATLTMWTERLRAKLKDKFPGPGEVTAFRPDFAVHGKFGQPCLVCATIVQRIRYAENETNYCPRCQTGGKLLADRSLSRLLKSDWPRSIDEWEETHAHERNT